MVWCDVVLCGVVWCGMVWCGVLCCGVMWCGVGHKDLSRQETNMFPVDPAQQLSSACHGNGQNSYLQ